MSPYRKNNLPVIKSSNREFAYCQWCKYERPAKLRDYFYHYVDGKKVYLNWRVNDNGAFMCHGTIWYCGPNGEDKKVNQYTMICTNPNHSEPKVLDPHPAFLCEEVNKKGDCPFYKPSVWTRFVRLFGGRKRRMVSF